MKPDVDTDLASMMRSTFQSILKMDKVNLAAIMFSNTNLDPMVDCLRRSSDQKNIEAYKERDKVAYEIINVSEVFLFELNDL